MKKIIRYLSILTLAVSLTGCASVNPLRLVPGLYSGPTSKNSTKMDASQAKVAEQQAKLEALQLQLQAKMAEFESNKVSQGSVFVHGTGRALDRVTNPEPAVVLAKDLNGMAAQALPKPPTKDVEKIDQAVDNSLSTNKVDQIRGAASLKSLEDRLADTEKQMAKMQAKYEDKLTDTQAKMQAALDRMNTVADGLAVKANKFDEANSMWGSLKLFVSNFWKFLLFILIVGVIWTIAKIVLSIYAPPIALGMNVVQGVGSKVIARGLSEVVSGGEKFKTEVEANLPAVLDTFKKGETKAEDVIKSVITSFATNHQMAQSADTQKIVQQLTATA